LNFSIFTGWPKASTTLDEYDKANTSLNMATKRLSVIVHDQKNEAFDSSMGNEVQLAKLGYEQGMLESRNPTIRFVDTWTTD
jgi:hypothetical protein